MRSPSLWLEQALRPLTTLNIQTVRGTELTEAMGPALEGMTCAQS